MIDIHMPRLSDTMEEGAIATWHKKPGDKVTAGDILVEIETDKAIMEYEAYDSGTLHEILVPEGEQAAIGTTIARIDDGRETSEPAVSAATGRPSDNASSADSPEQPANVDESTSHVDRAIPAQTSDSLATPGPAKGVPSAGQRRIATPLVRRLAREHAIDLENVRGSGPGGRIVRADIEDALTARQSNDESSRRSAASTPPVAGAVGSSDLRGSTTMAFDKMRQAISRRLTESSTTIPHFSVTAVADVEDLLALRAALNAQLEASSRPRVSVNDLIVRASALALRHHPGINASYSVDGNGSTQLHGRVNIGIAVATDSGLVVPVVVDADQKTVSQIAAESKELAQQAHSHKLTPSQMAGGTFTISNLGMYGIEHFTAIINPPEGAILAVGAAQPEPTVHNGTVAVRSRLRVTLSADHRIIDGALAAKFLRSLTELLHNPMNILA